MDGPIDHPALWARYLMGLLEGPAQCWPLPAFPWQTDEASLHHDIENMLLTTPVLTIPALACHPEEKPFISAVQSIKMLTHAGPRDKSGIIIDKILPALEETWVGDNDDVEQSNYIPYLRSIFDAMVEVWDGAQPSDGPSSITLASEAHEAETDTSKGVILRLWRSYAIYSRIPLAPEDSRFWHAVESLQLERHTRSPLGWLGFTLCLMAGDAGSMDKVAALLSRIQMVRKNSSLIKDLL